MERCPFDLQVIALLQAFPGYTRDTLLEEEAGFVQRMAIVLEEQAKEQELARRRARRK